MSLSILATPPGPVQQAAKAFAAALAVTCIGVWLESCTPWQRQAARSMVDASTIACMLANASLPDDRIRQVCGIVDALDGPLKDLLSAHRERVAAAESRGRLVGAVTCQIEERKLERLDRPSVLDAGADGR